MLKPTINLQREIALGLVTMQEFGWSGLIPETKNPWVGRRESGEEAIEEEEDS